MERMQAMPLGVVIERRDIDNPWQDHEWRAVAVIPGAPEAESWRVLNRGEGWVQYHAATLPLELHRKETEAYKVNLAETTPVIYIVLRAGEEADDPEITPFCVTASPFDSQDYLDSGEELVEAVPMPDGVIAWVQAFVDKHHVEEPFHKRRRRRHDEDAAEAPSGPPRLEPEGRPARKRGHG